MPIRLLFWVLLLGLGFAPAARGQADSAAPLRLDRSAITPRYPAAGQLEGFRNDRHYQYDREVPPPDNPLLRWLDWLWRQLTGFLQGESYRSFWQYVLMAAVAAMVLYFLYRARALDFLFQQRAGEGTLAYVVGQENIHEIDFDEALERVLAQRDYRLATRLLYLKTLKQLTDQELIHWQPNRTNYSYLQELAATPLQPEFERLTRRFEYVWYGDFRIGAEDFGEMREWAHSFSQQLSRR
ncbi:hypothetical protein GCM10027275_44780 [Rhabdobacter roseus]|uniref:Protein-glutamine gamma-glutamyltransferase-like C-terminal domain-containing protein n=1 Tax=Rhabdobacter roseus TaxID=1655419 RepID=A0A840TZ19_9BACT|nr:DUF4129 domain-containing protein [Rhabdobacter roseus]MBB5286852.1 hypothetical protein [Rhabdobacter roseus]